MRTARPLVLIPTFPGTNCEYDTAKAMEDAGAEAQIMVVRNLTAEAIAASVERFASAAQKAQIIFIQNLKRLDQMQPSMIYLMI